MVFYILPPRGSIKYKDLEEDSLFRLSVLLRIQNCDNDIGDIFCESRFVEKSACLIDGSAKDVISHFILRISFCEQYNLSQFFIKAEVKLFEHRISHMSYAELIHSLKTLQKFYKVLRKTDDQKLSHNYREIKTILTFLSEQFTLKNIANKIVEAGKVAKCTEGFYLPYYCVPSLVASRSVTVSQGFVLLTTRHLAHILTRIFSLHLSHSITIAAQLSTFDVDKRCLELRNRLQYRFSKDCSWLRTRKSLLPKISIAEIDQIASYFPSCMQSLHKSLRSKHRLKHHSRIKYVLFLKEVGVLLEDTLRLFAHEYSQPPVDGATSQSSCQHSWQRDSKRFTYGIRHLYGREGSRRNYSSHSCLSVQSALSDEVGCPFITEAATLNQSLKDDQKPINAADLCFKQLYSRLSPTCSKSLCYESIETTSIDLTKEPTSINYQQLNSPIDFYRTFMQLKEGLASSE